MQDTYLNKFKSYSNELDSFNKYADYKKKYKYELRFTLENDCIKRSIFSNDKTNLQFVTLGFRHMNYNSYKILETKTNKEL